MRTRLLDGYACALIFVSVASAKASIIVDHQPFNTGGAASDTLYSLSGQTRWQWLTDDFVWATNEQLTHVNFWGFYNADNPPAVEAFRLRLYWPRVSDSLPGNIVHEETIQNPTRTATGRFVQVGIGPREFFFESRLAAPVDLIENARYWLEVVQLGDIATTFRWETSVSDDISHAYRNMFVPDWQVADGGGDTAFQLISPEPSTLFLFTIAIILRVRLRRVSRDRHQLI